MKSSQDFSEALNKVCVADVGRISSHRNGIKRGQVYLVFLRLTSVASVRTAKLKCIHFGDVSSVCYGNNRKLSWMFDMMALEQRKCSMRLKKNSSKAVNTLA